MNNKTPRKPSYFTPSWDKKAEEKRGPKLGFFGKKKPRGICLADPVYAVLQLLAKRDSISASEWIERRILFQGRKARLIQKGIDLVKPPRQSQQDE